MPIPAQKYAKIVEPGYDALQFDAIDKKYRERRLLFSYMVEKRILKARGFFGGHVFSVFC